MTDVAAAAAPAAPSPTASPERLLLASQGFTGWLQAADCAVALTTYQAGRLFLLGRRPDGRLRAHERRIDHCQGLWTNGRSLWTAAKSVLWRFENDDGGADRRFVPREGRVTGQIDIHDIGVGDLGFAGGAGGTGPIFVATGYNCLATTSDQHSFRPLWRPPFISALVAEDRCHLNGLAMRDGRPAFVSAVSRSDVADGWRERRRDGGVVVDIASGEIVATGLSMPHSPRWHDGQLWVLNSGTGEFGRIDPGTGLFEPVAFCPGYARGLAFVAGHAVIGLSRPRHNQTFEGLALQEKLEAKDAVPRCGLVVIELATGRTVEWLRFEHTIEELYDVAILPGVAQAEAVGFQGAEINERVTPEV